MITLLCVALLVVCVSAVCSLIEAALFSISENRVRALIELKDLRAVPLLELKNNIHKAITSLVIVNNIANVLGSIWVGQVSSVLFDATSEWIVSLSFLGCIIVFSEILPKIIGEYYHESLALHSARGVSVLVRVFSPVHRIFDWVTKSFFLRDSARRFTEDDIKVLTKLGQHAGVIEKEEASIISKALTLNDIKVKEIMTPRIKMKMLDENQKLHNISEELIQSNFSRIPLFSESPDQVTGLLYKVDALKMLLKGKGDSTLAQLKRKVLRIPENKLIDKLLVELKSTRFHTAIVIDEYGGTSGLVTLEDILEQLVGHIYSEGDQQQRNQYQVISHDEIVVKGSTLVEEINDYFSIHLQNQHFIVSKFILDHLKRFPLQGEEFIQEGLLFRIEALTEKTIERVRVKLLGSQRDA